MTDGQDRIVRAAGSSDAKAVFDIRNHPDSRIFFHNHEPLEWEGHTSWFERQYLTGGENRCYVIEFAGRVVGYCRLDDWSAGSTLLSIAVDPDYRGRGLGTALLHETVQRIPAGTVVHAEVVAGNLASRALFESNHFILDRESEGVIYFLRTV